MLIFISIWLVTGFLSHGLLFPMSQEAFAGYPSSKATKKRFYKMNLILSIGISYLCGPAALIPTILFRFLYGEGDFFKFGFRLF